MIFILLLCACNTLPTKTDFALWNSHQIKNNLNRVRCQVLQLLSTESRALKMKYLRRLLTEHTRLPLPGPSTLHLQHLLSSSETPPSSSSLAPPYSVLVTQACVLNLQFSSPWSPNTNSFSVGPNVSTSVFSLHISSPATSSLLFCFQLTVKLLGMLYYNAPV